MSTGVSEQMRAIKMVTSASSVLNEAKLDGEELGIRPISIKLCLVQHRRGRGDHVNGPHLLRDASTLLTDLDLTLPMLRVLFSLPDVLVLCT